MSGSDGSGRLFRQLALGGAAAVVVAVAGLALGVPTGGCVGVALDFCDPKNWPDGGVPQIPCRCHGPGMPCGEYTQCCSMTCDNGTCTCTPDGNPCEEDIGCCSQICSFGFCAPSDGGAAGADPPIEACTGACIAAEPDFWSPPNLVFIGPEADAPPCPVTAASLGYEGHADPTGPYTCGACHCGPPSGSCGTPTTITASSADCSTEQGTSTPFDPPAGWDGGCTAAGAIPADAPCDGGPCVASITIAQLAPSETGCTPATDPPEAGPTGWTTFARACKPALAHGCDGGSGMRCMPLAPAGFRTCILHEGDVDCPVGLMSPYTERHTFFGGAMDMRGCSPCVCGAPTDGACAAGVSIYTDSACAMPLVTTTASSSGPVCMAVPSGAALGSKSASPPAYTPGACEPSGGAAVGAIIPVLPSTICCLPSG